MAITQNTFTGDGSNLGPFSFTFKWLESTDIKVTVAGVLKTAGTHYNLQSLNYTTRTGGQVLFTAGNAPADGAAIIIFRQTDDTDLVSTFYSGSAIRARDLNDNFTQALYKVQETTNYSVQDAGNITLLATYTFSNPVSGQTPTSNNHFATKAYVDGIAFNAGSFTTGDKGALTVNSASNWTLNTDVVTTTKILDGAVTAAKLADSYLTSASAASTYQTQAGMSTYAPLASPTFTGQPYVNGSYRGNITAVAALNIDCSLGNLFTKTISGASTFTVSNVPASRAYAFTLELTHTSGAITWFSGVTWPGGTAPTLTTGKVHLFMFLTDDGGTTWRASSLINY
jgi:hypothetical protein